MFPNPVKRIALVFFLLGLFLLGVIGIASLGVYFNYQSSITDAIPMAVSILGALLGIIVFFIWLRTKLNTGQLKLDISPARNRILYIFLLFVSLLNVGLWLFDPAKDNNYSGYSYFGLTIVFFILAIDRVQIRKKGICYDGALYRWEQIESYRWNTDAKKGLLLVINLKRSLLVIAGRFEIQIPIEKKDMTQALMEQFVHLDENAKR